MGEGTSQIERDIEAERYELGRNLQLLENKARSLTDWRTYYRSHPFAMIGAALGGGVLLGALTSGMRGREEEEEYAETERFLKSDESRYATPSAFAHSADRARRHFGDTWDHIADALLAVASAKAIEFVGQKVPGFREHFAARHPDYDGGYSTGRSV